MWEPGEAVIRISGYSSVWLRAFALGAKGRRFESCYPHADNGVHPEGRWVKSFGKAIVSHGHIVYGSSTQS